MDFIPDNVRENYQRISAAIHGLEAFGFHIFLIRNARMDMELRGSWFVGGSVPRRYNIHSGLLENDVFPMTRFRIFHTAEEAVMHLWDYLTEGNFYLDVPGNCIYWNGSQWEKLFPDNHHVPKAKPCLRCGGGMIYQQNGVHSYAETCAAVESVLQNGVPPVKLWAAKQCQAEHSERYEHWRRFGCHEFYILSGGDVTTMKCILCGSSSEHAEACPGTRFQVIVQDDLDWLARVCAPSLLALRHMNAEAEALRALPPMNAASFREALPVLEAVSSSVFDPLWNVEPFTERAADWMTGKTVARYFVELDQIQKRITACQRGCPELRDAAILAINIVFNTVHLIGMDQDANIRSCKEFAKDLLAVVVSGLPSPAFMVHSEPKGLIGKFKQGTDDDES